MRRLLRRYWRRPQMTPASWVTLAVILVVTGFVFMELQPRLLFRNTTPSGGDMGAHVWAPAYLKHHLLPKGRLSGWTPDWYDGFPALFFYFPLPSLLIALLSYLLPYGVAFKLVTVVGLLTLPTAAWAMGKLLGLRNPVPACLAIAMLPFMFERTYTIYGGNIASTLAGEFAFSISLSLALVFIGVFGRGLRTGRHRALAAVLLALVALCHIVPAFFAGAAAVLLTIIEIDKDRIRYAVSTLAVGGLLAAFWIVPFQLRIAYTNDMGWEKIVTYRQTLVPSGAHWLVLLAMLGALITLGLRQRMGAFFVALCTASALAFVGAPQSRLWNARLLPFWIITLYLLAGLAVGEVARGIGWLTGAVAALTEGTGPRLDVGAVDPGGLRAVSDEDDEDIGYFGGPPDEPEEPRRASLLQRIRDHWDEPVANAGRLSATAAALLLAVLLVATPLHIGPSWLYPVKTTDRSFIPDWVRWNYTGYEGKDSYPEYKALINTMSSVGRDHGCGRAMWEYEPELDRLGTPMALMLLPYWTKGCIGSMEGLFFESSATTPYHFLNQAELSFRPSSAQRDLPYRSLSAEQTRADVFAEGIHHLQLLGVRYYMTLTPEVQAVARTNPDLELLTTVGPFAVNYNRPNDLSGTIERTWEIYRVKGSDLVAPLTDKPAVMKGVEKGGKPWLKAAVDWYQHEDRWDVPLAASGPKDWPRVQGADPTPPRDAVAAATVNNIRATDDGISFDVDQPGTPVLVKASYFPNWQASGAKGPWRVTPNLMVVVPTAKHVSLHYGTTPVDVLGWVLTLLGIVGAVWLWRRGPMKFKPREADLTDAPPPADE